MTLRGNFGNFSKNQFFLKNNCMQANCLNSSLDKLAKNTNFSPAKTSDEELIDANFSSNYQIYNGTSSKKDINITPTGKFGMTAEKTENGGIVVKAEGAFRVYFSSDEQFEENALKKKTELYYNDDYLKNPDTFLYLEEKAAENLSDDIDTDDDYKVEFPVTDDEVANGVVSKTITLEQDPTGLVYSFVSTFTEEITYADGSKVINYYHGGKLCSQTEVIYDKDSQYDNLQSGNKRTTTTWSFADDGSYFKETTTDTYAEGQGWGHVMIATPWNLQAFDSSGNEVPFLSQAWRHIAFQAKYAYK